MARIGLFNPTAGRVGSPEQALPAYSLHTSQWHPCICSRPPGLAPLLTAVPGIQSNFAGCTSPQGLLCPTSIPPAGGRRALSLLCSHGFPCKIKITVKGMPGICPVSPLGGLGEGWCRLESPGLPGLTLWEPNPREMSIKCVSDGARVGCFTASQQGAGSRGKALPRGLSCTHTEAMSRGGALGGQSHG